MDLETVIQKSQFTRAIRQYFDCRDFLEVSTPCMVSCPGTEDYLRYFATSYFDHDGKMFQKYLRSSPELALKKILGLGASKLYEIGPCFRNHGESGPWHNPEFGMLEVYECHTTFRNFIEQLIGMLDFTQNSCAFAKSHFNFSEISWMTMAEAFKKFADINLIDLDNNLAAKAIAKKVVSVQPNDDFETAYFKVLIEKIEPALEKRETAVIYDYPPSQAALSVVEGGVAKRFEIYIKGIELCNGFLELLDPLENKLRYNKSQKKRGQLGFEQIPHDQEFLNALSNIQPNCVGVALGIDRWFKLLTT